MSAAPDSAPRASVFVVDADVFDLAALAAELNDAERREAATIRAPKRHGQFVASRLLVRRALRAWAGEAAETWRLASEASGRPILTSTQPQSTPPAISLSHSGRYAVCALCDVGAIGVDVEEIRARDIDGLAGEALADCERARLNGAGESRLETFYQFWTLKEAASKALGTGLATPFRDLVFEIDAPRLRFCSAPHGARADFVSFVPFAGTRAAIALFAAATAPPPSIEMFALHANGRFETATVEVLARSF